MNRRVTELLDFAMWIVIIVAVGWLLAGLASANEVVDRLQNASVTIKSSRGQGSGVLFTRQVDGENVTFVWTAAHVIEDLRKTRTVLVKGVTRTVVEFDDAAVVQEFRQNGRRIGEQKMDARVVRYSDADKGEDLALLEVRKRNFSDATVKFYNGDIPALGTKLIHVGSLRGQFGSNSLTTGVVSQIGRVLDLGANGVIFDQVSTPSFPGSSGGGVFLEASGEYIGMLVRGGGETFGFIVPIRRLRDWAKQSGVEWAIDASVPMPTQDDFRRLPVEDDPAFQVLP